MDTQPPEKEPMPRKALVLALIGFLLINLAVLSHVLEWNDYLVKTFLILGILPLVPAWFILKKS